ncbi:MAG: hypothetical protein A2Z72_06000 [Omnitrophica bacterium RBG_13_46_9]|nr:MAG: hypothetical protein A2Z72_06000 [Omnitrophica bacterium RBG_13_46_9]
MRRLIDRTISRFSAISPTGRAVFRKSGKMNEFLEKKPLMLKLETTNICDARCNFCAYKKMRRPGQIMSLELFEKTARDYAVMGGGAVTLTPCAGELLTDPHLIERLRILTSYKEIGNIGFTTNLIGHMRFSDRQWIEILRSTYYLQVSSGGLDRNTYLRMFGVDKAKDVLEGIERIFLLKKKSGAKTIISLAFRTDKRNYLKLKRKGLLVFNKNGVYISNIATYGNWAGMLDTKDKKGAIKISERRPAIRSGPCAVMATMIGVLSSGTVTACSCCDFDGALFPLGNIAEKGLADLYAGSGRNVLFEKSSGAKEHLCFNCSHYIGLGWMIHRGALDLKNPGNIPLKFYHFFSGG